MEARLLPHHQRDLSSRLSYSHESFRKQAEQRRSRPLIIQRAPQSLRRGIDEGYLVPDVVSIGPYHRGAAHLAEMEPVKEAVAHDLCAYASSYPPPAAAAAVEPFLAAVRQVVPEAKLCYAEGLESLGVSDDEFANMMVVDGCFLLAVAAILTREYPHEHASWTHGRMLRIMKDIMLFENQIPWVVVHALTNLRPVDMDKFVAKILAYFDVAAEPGSSSAPQPSSTAFPAGVQVQIRPPVHLLDMVHQRHLGGPPPADAAGPYCDYARPFAPFTSAVELAEAGIRIHGNRTCRVRDVRVEAASRCAVFRLGRLALPPLALSWLPRCWLINMVALECVTDRFDHSGVSSYLAILSSLISTERDVQELREKRILFSTMSDRRTVDFFQSLLDPLPRQELYLRTLKGIVHLRARRSYRSQIHAVYYRNRKIIFSVVPLLSLLVAIVGLVVTNTLRQK